jgi:hypothetical protein
VALPRLASVEACATAELVARTQPITGVSEIGRGDVLSL